MSEADAARRRPSAALLVVAAAALLSFAVSWPLELGGIDYYASLTRMIYRLLAVAYVVVWILRLRKQQASVAEGVLAGVLMVSQVLLYYGWRLLYPLP